MTQNITVLTEGHAHDVVLRAFRASQYAQIEALVEAMAETEAESILLASHSSKRPDPWVVRGFPVICSL
jgi:hypothetical protein